MLAADLIFYRDLNLLKKIKQFPTKEYFDGFNYDKKVVGDTCKFWLSAQEKINIDTHLKFLKLIMCLVN